ncbi:hypothetical protein [Actinomadura macrotermitis]|uniref:Uncharacterized protein n=1 Tax=Actinomadura macrotermitis TaxID=2585200 RepID=A0A7K0BTJ2_9ACTN|nr:hypothetical protein [Actinomadura macrotermitis]MQY04489.1 hypothetical protein [Actinomadura macrotermitis]
MTSLRARGAGKAPLVPDGNSMFLEFARTHFREGFTRGLPKGFREGFGKSFRKWFAKGFDEGLAEGNAYAICMILEARGLEIPYEVSDRIYECPDLGKLYLWVRRAVTVSSADELFRAPEPRRPLKHANEPGAEEEPLEPSPSS